MFSTQSKTQSLETMKIYFLAISLLCQWQCLGFVRNRLLGFTPGILCITKQPVLRLASSTESIKSLEQFNNECKTMSYIVPLFANV